MWVCVGSGLRQDVEADDSFVTKMYRPSRFLHWRFETLPIIPFILPLADQDIRFTKFADDLFRTVPLLRHASLLLESV